VLKLESGGKKLLALPRVCYAWQPSDRDAGALLCKISALCSYCDLISCILSLAIFPSAKLSCAPRMCPVLLSCVIIQRLPYIKEGATNSVVFI
jgi:hypothetical protein